MTTVRIRAAKITIITSTIIIATPLLLFLFLILPPYYSTTKGPFSAILLIIPLTFILSPVGERKEKGKEHPVLSGHPSERGE